MTDTTAQPTGIHAGMTVSETLRAFDAKLDFLAAAMEQLQKTILQTTPACATCLAEERQGTRPGHNLANTITDGTAYCNEHLDIVGGRLAPRKSSGLIITGG